MDKRQVVLELSPDRDAVVRRFGTGKGHNFEDGVVIATTVPAWRRLVDEGANAPDDLARAITIVDDTSGRLARLIGIWRLRA